jgi:hypothetical protein
MIKHKLELHRLEAERDTLKIQLSVARDTIEMWKNLYRDATRMKR